MKQLLILSCLLTGAVARRFCLQDSDCSRIGNLECIKSACNWGNCGCRRGYVSRFIGSTKLFECVKLKKIGESCSTDDKDGVCGAANSDCVDSKCVCDAGYESRWGGEECLFEKTPYPTETCSASLGAACAGGSTCASSGAWYGAFSGVLAVDLQNSAFDDTPNTCACAAGYRTEIPNAYYDASYVGGSVPTCTMNGVGDLCYQDSDCGEIQAPDGSGGWTTTNAANCTDNACACASGMVVDVSGLFCASALSYGQTCIVGNVQVNSSVGVCDGGAGLRCGSPCDLDVYLGSGDYTCQCDPAYTDNSGTCTANQVGDPCNGDLNCKAIDSRATCDEGLCKSSAKKRLASVLLLVASLAWATC